MSGKGDKPRPLSIPYKDYSERYDAIFRKNPVLEKEEDEKPHENEAGSESS